MCVCARLKHPTGDRKAKDLAPLSPKIVQVCDPPSSYDAFSPLDRRDRLVSIDLGC